MKDPIIERLRQIMIANVGTPINQFAGRKMMAAAELIYARQCRLGISPRMRPILHDHKIAHLRLALNLATGSETMFGGV